MTGSERCQVMVCSRRVRSVLTGIVVGLLVFSVVGCKAPGYQVNVVPMQDLNEGRSEIVKLHVVWRFRGQDKLPERSGEWFDSAQESGNDHAEVWVDPNGPTVKWAQERGAAASSDAKDERSKVVTYAYGNEGFEGATVYANYNTSIEALELTPGNYRFLWWGYPNVTIYCGKHGISLVPPEVEPEEKPKPEKAE